MGVIFQPRNDQIERTIRVFEKLAAPNNTFYMHTRKHIFRNDGNRYRDPGLSILLPMQLWYHRLGECRNDYPPGIFPDQIISAHKEADNLYSVAYCSEIKENFPFSGARLRVTHSTLPFNEQGLQVIEHFSDIIIEQWNEFKKGEYGRSW
ncbi:MAG: hypothetical protein V1900_03795 [Candidatus Aenigmatarchaeota archaeon]